jgi:hypothetical protein
MTENIVAGLFGLNPQMYGEQQRRSALSEGIALAQLDPAARGAAMTYAGARGLGNAIGGALGAEDPQLKMISARNSIAQQIDQSDPESILKGAQMLAQMGDQQGAMALAQYARQAQGDVAQTKQRLAAALASEAASKRERVQADPEKVRLARSVAELSGPEGSIEYNTAYAKSLREQVEPKAEKEKPIASGVNRDAISREMYDNKIYVDLTATEKAAVNKRLEAEEGRKAAASASKVVLPAGESEFLKEMGKLDAKKVSDAMVTRETASSTIKSLNKLASLPDNELITGQFATGRVGVANLIQTLGLASASDAKKVAGSQEYQKVAGDVILQTLGGKLGSGFSNADREFIQGLIPQLETNPNARRQLISFMQQKNQDIVAEAIRTETYARKNKGLSGFEPNIPMSVAPSQPRPYSGLTNEQLDAKIRAAQAQQPR